MSEAPRDLEAQMLSQMLTKLGAVSDMMSDLRVDVARVEQEVKSLSADLSRLERTEQRVSDLERRFDRALWQLRGAWAVLVALAAIVGYVLKP